MARASVIDYETMTKPCTKCKEQLPLEAFKRYVRPERVQGKLYYRSICKECDRPQRTLTNRKYVLRQRYNISLEDQERMLAEQGGCATCGRQDPNGLGWHIDHDHKCCPRRGHSCGECIRGVLCLSCNIALGNVGDCTEVLKKMIDYLEASRG